MLGAAELHMGIQAWVWVPYVALPVLIVAGLALLSRGQIRVTSTEIRAGKHALPLSAVATVEELDAAHTRRMRGPAADPAAHVFARPWISSSVRIIPKLDDAPYLLVTTRRPDLLAAALIAAASNLPA